MRLNLRPRGPADDGPADCRGAHGCLCRYVRRGRGGVDQHWTRDRVCEVKPCAWLSFHIGANSTGMYLVPVTLRVGLSRLAGWRTRGLIVFCLVLFALEDT